MSTLFFKVNDDGTYTFGISDGQEYKPSRKNKGKCLLEFPANFTAIDLETTGLDSQYDEIIEISAIKVRNFEIIDKFSTLVKPEEEIPSFITELTGISNEMVVDAPSVSKALPLLLDFISNDIVIGHNVSFDINFLYDNSIRCGMADFSNDYIDTLRLARKLLKELEHHRLQDLVKHFKISDKTAHRAEADTINCIEIYTKLYDIWLSHPNKDTILKKHNVHSKDITTDKTVFDESHPLYGKVCVFTGVLERMQRKEAMQIVADLGGINGDSVTAKTNYLILGNNDYCSTIKDGKSSKQKKAEQLKLKGKDIEIISEDVFYSLIEE